jgi:hypothetical protein
LPVLAVQISVLAPSLPLFHLGIIPGEDSGPGTGAVPGYLLPAPVWEPCRDS